MRVSHIPSLFSAARSLRRWKHGILAVHPTPLVTQIPTEMAEISTRMAKFLPR